MTKNPLLLALGAIGLLSALALVGTFAYTTAHNQARQEPVIATPKASVMPSVPVPALDDKSHIRAWIGQDQVIASQASTGCFPDLTIPPCYLVNLHTGASRQLKTLPSNDLAPDSSGIYRSIYSSPSPDGKWMLYHETKQGGQRWRLERIDGSATAFVPQTKAFVQPDVRFPIPIWFPDSQKWIASDDEKPVVFQYDLTTPNAKPRRIAVPFAGVWSPTGEGHLASYSRDQHQVVFVSLKDGSTHSVPLVRDQGSKPRRTLMSTSLSQDGKWELALYFGVDGERVRFELKVISLVDGSRKEIPSDFHLSRQTMSLSPNGKTLLYWGKHGARRVDL